MLDWKNEWSASLLWSGAAFGITVAVFVVLAWLLTRFTRWGRQFCRITLPYFRPGRDWVSCAPLLSILMMLWMTVLAVRLDVLLSYWTNGLFTAMQDLNAAAFRYFLVVFGVLTAVYFVHSRVEYLIEQAFIIRWRSWLNEHMVTDWLTGRAYHRGHFVSNPVDNPDQRIQEDTTAFVVESLGLSLGAVRSVVALASFTPILWGLSGALSVSGHTIPGAMVFLAYFYVVAASFGAFRIGRPLIRLNFLNEGLGASFRYALVRLRDHSEDVAFHSGEEAERTTLAARFQAIIHNNWRIVFRLLKFDGFNIAVSQIALVVPYLIQAPRFFAQAITLGDVQQTTVAFGHVHGALSFFRNSYGAFAAYRAILDRLTGLLEANSQTRALPSVTVTECADGLDVDNLTVQCPDGTPLIKDLTVHVDSGQALLVTGASGTGKTTLLRSLAGLWPYAHGTIHRPTPSRAVFLPQHPYLPLGGLRTALTYPQLPRDVSDERIRDALHAVHLSHLEGRLDEEINWTRALSTGEQQRLGIARILINRPRVALLDEATSALDAGLEHGLYALIRTRLPDCTLISVGDHNRLEAFHTHRVHLLGHGQWNITLVARQHPAIPASATFPARQKVR
jgi:vitamin B12/bleomycin/antimicrobial peptide transport system ATP-binding/permease protein